MTSKRSRLGLIGVSALALCVTVGMSAGSADAKKKKKGGKGGTVTVVRTAPTTIPPSTDGVPPGCGPFFPDPPCTTPPRTSLVLVPLTVGKQAKGKTVSLNSVSVTYSLTGTPRSGPTPAAASGVTLQLTAPNGRTVGIFNPGFGDANATNIGPVTVTPNSPFSACQFFDDTNTTTVCSAASDPDQTVGPPAWAGIIGNSSLAQFGGVPARGTWNLRVRNLNPGTAATLSSVSVSVGTTGGKKAKK